MGGSGRGGGGEIGAIAESQSGRCLVEPRQPGTSLDQTRRSFEYMAKQDQERDMVCVVSLISLEGVKVDLNVETRHLRQGRRRICKR